MPSDWEAVQFSKFSTKGTSDTGAQSVLTEIVCGNVKVPSGQMETTVSSKSVEAAKPLTMNTVS